MIHTGVNSTWNDRQARKFAQNAEGQTIGAQLKGLDQLHTGFEVEVAYQPMSMLRVDAAMGIGNWTYTDDVKAEYQDYDSGTKTTKEATIYLLDQGVRVTGTDAWSWDAPFSYTAEKYKQTKDPSIIWEGHRAGMVQGYSHIEKLNNLDQLPNYGFKVSAFPFKIKNGSAGFVRVVAIFE